MQLRMTPKEIDLLSSFLKCTSNYLEFGAGGSTVLAASLVRGHVWSVDSSVEWLEKVEQAVDRSTEKLSCHHVDIGPVGLWGYPLNHSLRSKFPEYYSRIWNDLTPQDVDFVLVDGRFRVASFCEANRRVRSDTFIAFHDYGSRAEYHCVEKIAHMVAAIDDLAIFLPRKSQPEQADELMKEFAYNPF
jgi:hypothetical protein